MINRRLKDAITKNKRGLIFVLSGPSGSGKTTLADKLVRDADLKDTLRRSVSVTTRPRRPGEIQGRDYFFYTPRQFLFARKAKKILEWTKYLGYYYATPKHFAQKALRQKKCLVLSIDLKGERRLRRLYPKNTVSIFVRPPSITTLRARIEKRCPGTRQEEISGRLGLAAQELAQRGSFDYSVVNRDLDRTYVRLKRIVLKEIAAL